MAFLFVWLLIMGTNVFPGPYCEEIGLDTKSLISRNINQLPQGRLNNGIVIELKNLVVKSSLPVSTLFNWLCVLQPNLRQVNEKSLNTRVNRTFANHKKLKHKKKLPNYKSSAEFLKALFFENVDNGQRITAPKISDVNVVSTNLTDSSVAKESKIQFSPQLVEVQIDVFESKLQNVDTKSSQTDFDSEIHGSPNSNSKQFNLLKYNLNKKQKTCVKLEDRIELKREKLTQLNNKLGHFSIRNVNKRDENARKTRHLLRENQFIVAKQKQQIDHLTGEQDEKCEHIMKLCLENNRLKNEQSEENLIKVQTAEKTKLSAQKAASYFKTSSNNLRKQLKSDPSNGKIKELKQIISEKDKEISQLQYALEMTQEELKDKHCTRNADGSFSDSVRVCAFELAGLEVACAKITPVIQAVAQHIFSRDIEKSELPNRTTIQTIIDEGHYLAKTFISSLIDTATHWGLNRDGTTRKKRKIVDTSVTLNSGDVISLGFTTVAHETAKTINAVTKQQLSELANLNTSNLTSEIESEEFIANTLKKLAFTMSDRASNEKLADKLLDEWRDDLLKECEDDVKQKVHHFHCMAHVLLGFHKYACDDLKSLEKTIVEENGPIGRDALSFFKMWSKKGTGVERAVRTTSDTFGPVGDHHGLRDRWEAYCSSKGIKSIIGNYRDNRFNAIFQTSAEVYLHAHDIQEVINTVRQPNLKLKSVQADLKSDSIMTFLQCMGLVYVKITGPYWNLVTCCKVPYLQLYSHIQDLAAFLSNCSKQPELLLNTEGHWSDQDPLDLSHIPHREKLVTSLFELSEDTRELLFKIIKTVTAAMLRTVEKQLVDFLPGGQYGQKSCQEELLRTEFGHVTNLGCEHHFGDLDSSQKRRPNASMHHHSSIQILKRNREKFIDWLKNMDTNERIAIMKNARKGGKSLRQDHLEFEKKVVEEICMDMLKEKDRPAKKRRVTKVADEEEEESEGEFELNIAQLNNQLPTIDTLDDNEYVAVAYQDCWYPGCVVRSEAEHALVSFMTPCRKPGHFSWPTRKDEQLVSREFILKRGFLPECINSGRQWFFADHLEISSLFVTYKNFYF